MSFVRVVQLLSARKIVTIKKTSYALIDGRIHWVAMIDNEVKLLNHDPQMTINQFALFCEQFDPSQEGSILDIPEEPEIYSEDFDYIFTKMPRKQECPHCLTMVLREREKEHSAILQGKYAYCPVCGQQLYRGLRADGHREDGLDFNTIGHRISVNHPRMPRPPQEPKPKVEKPKEKTTEEIMASGELKPMKKKMNFGKFKVVV